MSPPFRPKRKLQGLFSKCLNVTSANVSHQIVFLSWLAKKRVHIACLPGCHICKQWNKEQAIRCCTADVCLCQSVNWLYNNNNKMAKLVLFSTICTWQTKYDHRNPMGRGGWLLRPACVAAYIIDPRYYFRFYSTPAQW